MPYIGENQRREPNLYRPDHVSSFTTWRCSNPACRVWTKPSLAAVPGTCNECGTPKPANQ